MRPSRLLGSLTRLAGRGRSLRRAAPAAVRSAVLHYGRPRFVKSYREHVALEFQRGRAIHTAAARSGIFRAPAPLQLLEEHDLIVWECVDGLVEMRDHLMRDLRERPGERDARAILFERAGRALAAIHEALADAGPAPEHWPFRAVRSGDARLDAAVLERLGRSPLRPLHWDFVCGNLFVTGRRPGPLELVVIDASPNWYLHPPADTRVASPVYVDAAMLAFSLWCHPHFSPAVRHEAESYLDAFIAGYREGAGFLLDRATVQACGAHVAGIYQDFADGRQTGGQSGRSEKGFRLKAAGLLRERARATLAAEGGRP